MNHPAAHPSALSGLMDHYAVIGNPVAHSKSPQIHAAFAAQTGQAMDYRRVLCPLDGFAPLVRRLATEGPDRLKGCNVTVPFKFEVPALAATCSHRVALAQAANTLRFDEHGWAADNTDGLGLVRDIEHNARRPLAGQRVLLIGAGGASAGVLGPLIEARPAALQVVNRSPERAAALVARHAALAEQSGVALSAGGLDAAEPGFDVVINGSASSMAGAAVPVADRCLKPSGMAVDMMYGAAAEPFLAWAAAQGAEGRDGLGMLVEQAAAAFAFWRGVQPDTAPVLAALRSAG